MSGAGETTLRFRHRWHEEVGSTNDLATAAAAAGEPAGLWVLARRQTAGRGRHGRAWLSPPGNFHGSLLLRPRRAPAEAATLSLLAALAVGEALHALSDGRVVARLKWPNDVLVQGAKLAGILLEGGAAAGWVVVGIGVNLHHAPALADRPATSLAALGLSDVTPETFLAALERPLAERYAVWEAGGFAPLRRAWLDAAHGIGHEVTLRRGRETIRGRLADLAADGSIMLESPVGNLIRFTAGELAFAVATPPSAEPSGPDPRPVQG